MSLRNLLMTAGVVMMTAATLWAKPAFPPDVVKEPTTRPAEPPGPLDFTVKTIDGKEQNLADYKGKVVMIVNVASRCGFTPQYKQLEEVYKRYSARGFVILGFPANNFNHQEPGTNAEIKNFCSTKYDVTFPMMAKISVLGDDKAPLYKLLTEPQTAGDFAGEIGWNFTKFIVDRNGNVIARFNSKAKPDDPQVIAEIEKALNANATPTPSADVKKYYYIGGAVQRPGGYCLCHGPVTIREAVEAAKPNVAPQLLAEIIVVHHDGNKTEKVSLDPVALLQRGEHNDTIRVDDHLTVVLKPQATHH